METHLALSGANVLVVPVLQLSHKDRLSLRDRLSLPL